MRVYPTITINILSVPERIANIKKMVDQLNQECFTAQISLDRDHVGLWTNARYTLSRLATTEDGADYRVILSDDVILCGDFVKSVRRMLYHLPEPCMVGLFCTSKHGMVKRAMQEGATWINAGSVWGQGVCIPRDWIPPMLDWLDYHLRNDAWLKGDDSRYTLWGYYTGHAMRITVPALVNHDLSIPSVLKDNVKDAVYFCDGSGTDIEWHEPPYQTPYKLPLHVYSKALRDIDNFISTYPEAAK